MLYACCGDLWCAEAGGCPVVRHPRLLHSLQRRLPPCTRPWGDEAPSGAAAVATSIPLCGCRSSLCVWIFSLIYLSRAYILPSYAHNSSQTPAVLLPRHRNSSVSVLFILRSVSSRRVCVCVCVRSVCLFAREIMCLGHSVAASALLWSSLFPLTGRVFDQEIDPKRFLLCGVLL